MAVCAALLIFLDDLYDCDGVKIDSEGAGWGRNNQVIVRVRIKPRPTDHQAGSL